MTGRFQVGPNYRSTFGKNVFLGSTDFLVESATVACATVPTETIDGFTQKILRQGQLMARITGTGGGLAADVGKVGPFDSGASDGRQTKANIVGFNNSFLPWQMLERDADIGIVYDGYILGGRAHLYTAGVQTTINAAIVATTIAATDLVGASMNLRIRKQSTNPGGGEFDTWPV